MVKKGELNSSFMNVESEFAAMSAVIGASAAGARAYTATASQGLLYMSEAVYNASGLGLPVVMTVANRAIGAPINIWNDHSDAMSQRDAGWIQLYAETNQEAADLHIQAFRIAEELSNPVMVCMDGFLLTHASERVDLPGQRRDGPWPSRPRRRLPRYRLPPDIMDAEIGRILAMGVTLELNTTVTDILAELTEAAGGNAGEGGFDAAFVAVGAHIGKRAYIPAGDSARIMDAVSLLHSVEDGEPPMLGRRVAVYGGGNRAMDAARTARRLGASEAVVVYRRTRDRMPARDIEVEEAQEEGRHDALALHDRARGLRRAGDREDAARRYRVPAADRRVRGAVGGLPGPGARPGRRHGRAGRCPGRDVLRRHGGSRPRPHDRAPGDLRRR
jgi:hypothetical protein